MGLRLRTTELLTHGAGPSVVPSTHPFTARMRIDGCRDLAKRPKGDVGAEALVVPRWVLWVASATSIATGGLFIADFVVGEILGLRPVPLSVILVGALLAYMQLVADFALKMSEK
jgi:hypothetical protein